VCHAHSCFRKPYVKGMHGPLLVRNHDESLDRVLYFDNEIEYVCQPADDASVCSRMSFWFVVRCGSHPSHPSLLPSLQTKNLLMLLISNSQSGSKHSQVEEKFRIRTSTCLELERMFCRVQKTREGMTADTLRGKLF
jgi:hypothetical protein